MKYRVVVTPEAQAGIRAAFEYIHARAPLNAARWLQGLYDRIETLERSPERCAYARERHYLDDDLRQLVFKSHRIVFKADRAVGTVWVLYVRRARRAIGERAAGDEG